MNENKAGLGYQDFEEVRTQHIFYIDKTDFIREWWECADKVTLITRPRRFGKTLNLSTINCFFSNRYAGRSDLFEGLAIWEEKSSDGDYKYRKMQGTFPVIFLSFANIKAAKYGDMEYKISEVIAKLYTFMNKVALNTFSSFDSGNKPSGQAEPERFYHGFVLGMVVNLTDAYKVRSNRESGYGRYDVMIEPIDRTKKAFIFEFRVLDPDEDEETLEDTLANAHTQINEKQYEAELVSDGFAPGQIRKYGFAFRGKECLIGSL